MTSVQAQPSLKAIFQKSKATFAALIPQHLDADRVINIAYMACFRDQKLREAADANPISLISAICQALSLGLEPGGAGGEAYLLPFNEGYGANRKPAIQFVPGYQGLAKLARQSGVISNLWARVVYACDELDVVEGDTPRLTHKPKLDASDEEQGDDAIVGAYLVAVFKDGSKQFWWVPRKRIEKARSSSKSYLDRDGKPSRSSPWVAWFPEMCMKTAFRVASKQMPRSTELSTALELEQRAETGEIGAVTEIDTPEEIAAHMAAKTSERTADIKRQLKGAAADAVGAGSGLGYTDKSITELRAMLERARANGDPETENIELELDARRDT